MTRRIFIGDIQGCREELERLLEELRFDPATDELHPVGDFVNRGPDSAGVLRLMRGLDAGGVLGNHDLHGLARANGSARTKKRDTLDELLAADDAEELVAWLTTRPFLRAWPDCYLVHAGLHPGWNDPAGELAGIDPLRPTPAARFAVGVRYCDPTGALPDSDVPPPPDPFAPWFTFYDAARHGNRTVVFGHWAMRGLVDEGKLRGLDTGCVWGGKLTAWIPEEDRLVHVHAARCYSPY